eukprot:s6153_g6.t1
MTSTSTSSDTFTTTSSKTRFTSFSDELFDELQRSTNVLLRTVTDLENATVSATTDFGKLTVVKLTPSSSMAVTVLNESAAAAALPAEVLRSDALLVLTSFEDEVLPAGQRHRSWASSRPIEVAVPAVDVTLIDLDTLRPIDVSLDRPMYVRIARVSPEPNWICAYLRDDGVGWSTEGVRLAVPAELEAAFGALADTSGVWCATLHLSIFAAFVDILLDCTSANLLTPDGLQQILERGDWWSRVPAVSLWLVLAASLLLILFAYHRDLEVRQAELWREDFFLDDGAKPSSLCSSLPCLRCPRCTWGKAEAAAPGELHQPEAPTLRASPTSAQWQKEQREEVMKRLQRLRPTWTSGLQEHAICRNTLCEVGRSLGLHITSIESHIWGRHGWVQGSLALQRSPKLREVAIELEERLPSAYLLVHTSHLHRLRATILASHPVYELCMFDLHMTAAKRAKICMDCVMGSLCFAALFFSVDGSALSARSPAECPLEQGSLIWYLFVATFSVLLNFIPRSLQICLAQRGFVRTSLSPHQHLIRTRCKDVAFWLWGICLSTFHLLVIMAFLSDLVESDEWKWMFAFTIVLARKLLLVPLLACVLSSLGTQLADCRQPGGVAAPPKKFGLDLQLAKSGESESPVSRDCGPAWVGKVHELAGRGISLRQLLDFYAELGHSLTGHFDPEKSTTHDVVRQLIIPNSLDLRDVHFYTIQVHRATGLAKRDEVTGRSALYCVVVVQSGAVSKPWKGGGRTSCIESTQNPVWAEAFLVEDVLDDESLHFSIRDRNSDDCLGKVVLPVWSMRGGMSRELFVGATEGSKLQVSIASHATRAQARKSFARLQEAALVGGEDGGDDLSNTDEQVLDLGAQMHRKFVPRASRGVLTGEGHDWDLPEMRGFAFAEVVNHRETSHSLAQRMVTHSWRNKFTHLIAAVLADALDVEKYGEIADLLTQREFGTLNAKLLVATGKLDIRYWICAFSVNQHAGICASPPPTDSTGHPITPCHCLTPKHFDGDLSEMNKFDDMMAYLKGSLRKQGEVRLQQVIACESDFSLFQRVWCLAELMEAHALHLPQAVKIHSAAARDRCVDMLVHLDVNNAEASFAADKERVLSKIEDTAGFNAGLQDLVLHRLERFLQGDQARSSATVIDEVVLAAVSVAF